MHLAATACGSARLQRRFQRHAATVVRGARRAGIKGAGAEPAPYRVPVRFPLAVTVPRVVVAMIPPLAAARRQRVGRLAVAASWVTASAEDARVCRIRLATAHSGWSWHIRAVGVTLHVARGTRHQRIGGRRSLGSQHTGRQQYYPACSLHFIVPFEKAWRGEPGARSSGSHAPCSMLPAHTRRGLAIRAVALVTRGFNRVGRIARPDACSRWDPYLD